MDTCPPLEDIAAFLDGTLAPEERERITEHLARCESCYEVFAGAVHFQEESSAEDTDGRGVLQFPLRDESGRTGWRVPQWTAIAASLVLLTGLGFFIWRNFLTPPRIVVANLVEQIPSRKISAEELYPFNRYRGLEEDTSFSAAQPAFMVGALLVDLRMSLGKGDAKTSEELLDLLSTTLKKADFMSEAAAKVRSDAQKLQKTPSYVRVLAEKAAIREAELDESYLLPEFLAFGKWTEAGRLAAVTQTQRFFDRRANRRFLSSLLKNPPSQGDESLEAVPNHLQTIEEIWDRGDFSEKDYDALAEHFQKIIKAYESSSSELDDLLPPRE